MKSKNWDTRTNTSHQPNMLESHRRCGPQSGLESHTRRGLEMVLSPIWSESS